MVIPEFCRHGIVKSVGRDHLKSFMSSSGKVLFTSSDIQIVLISWKFIGQLLKGNQNSL